MSRKTAAIHPASHARASTPSRRRYAFGPLSGVADSTHNVHREQSPSWLSRGHRAFISATSRILSPGPHGHSRIVPAPVPLQSGSLKFPRSGGLFSPPGTSRPGFSTPTQQGVSSRGRSFTDLRAQTSWGGPQSRATRRIVPQGVTGASRAGREIRTAWDSGILDTTSVEEGPTLEETLARYTDIIRALGGTLGDEGRCIFSHEDKADRFSRFFVALLGAGASSYRQVDGGRYEVKINEESAHFSLQHLETALVLLQELQTAAAGKLDKLLTGFEAYLDPRVKQKIANVKRDCADFNLRRAAEEGEKSFEEYRVERMNGAAATIVLAYDRTQLENMGLKYKNMAAFIKGAAESADFRTFIAGYESDGGLANVLSAIKGRIRVTGPRGVDIVADQLGRLVNRDIATLGREIRKVDPSMNLGDLRRYMMVALQRLSEMSPNAFPGDRGHWLIIYNVLCDRNPYFGAEIIGPAGSGELAMDCCRSARSWASAVSNVESRDKILEIIACMSATDRKFARDRVVGILDQQRKRAELLTQLGEVECPGGMDPLLFLRQQLEGDKLEPTGRLRLEGRHLQTLKKATEWLLASQGGKAYFNKGKPGAGLPEGLKPKQELREFLRALKYRLSNERWPEAAELGEEFKFTKPRPSSAVPRRQPPPPAGPPPPGLRRRSVVTRPPMLTPSRAAVGDRRGIEYDEVRNRAAYQVYKLIFEDDKPLDRTGLRVLQRGFLLMGRQNASSLQRYIVAHKDDVEARLQDFSAVIATLGVDKAVDVTDKPVVDHLNEKGKKLKELLSAESFSAEASAGTITIKLSGLGRDDLPLLRKSLASPDYDVKEGDVPNEIVIKMADNPKIVARFIDAVVIEEKSIIMTMHRK